MNWHGRKPKALIPREDPTSLGNVLLGMGFIREEQLKAAVDYQSSPDNRLGAVLLRMGVLTQERLEIALVKQAELRREKVDYARASRQIFTDMRDKANRVPRALNELNVVTQALLTQAKKL